MKIIYLLIVTAVIMLLVPSCTAITNHPPIITSLKVEQGVVFSPESYQVKCSASDVDGDKLSYEWSASGGDIDVDGPSAIWIAPESDGIFGITVGVTDGHGGEVTDSLSITVKVNHTPTINSLIADADWVTPSSTRQIECDAEDPDGDDLSYEWSDSEGDISGTGRIVTWTAPEALGTYDITVKVTDDSSDETVRSLSINVAPNKPPVIQDLIVTPEEPQYLKEFLSGYRIFHSEVCEFECIAYDPEGDELSYDWSAKEGNVLAEGSRMTWTSPNEESKVTITVTVSDSSGSIATESIDFKVDYSKCPFR